MCERVSERERERVCVCETWSMPMGKSAVGCVVSQSLKSGCGLVMLSRAFSSSLSQWMRRWQFCSISQWPLWAAVSSSCSATYTYNTRTRHHMVAHVH